MMLLADIDPAQRFGPINSKSQFAWPKLPAQVSSYLTLNSIQMFIEPLTRFELHG
jgi:hypothetical protein